MKWKRREPVLKPRGKDSIVEQLARIRGISDIQEFLFPSIRNVINPSYLMNAVEASEMILDAIYKGKKICISTDPDSDGIMSTGLSYNYLKQFTDNIYYIFHQRDKGHGIENSIEQIEEDTDLLLILDSSTNSVKACREIKEKGIDTIVLDHHVQEVENPHVLLVNPQQKDCPYQNKDISGAGVVYKVLQLVDKKLDSGTIDDYIDMVAVGMYGDMMRVDVLENRYLIIEGMKNIKNTGLRAILDVKKIDTDDVNSQTLGFDIVPLLNGSARMQNIELALQLVTSTDYKECIHLVEELMKLNEKRKTITKELSEKYIRSIKDEDKIIIAIDEEASKSFNGLVATKLSQEYKKPALVMRSHKGTLAGSYRTYGDFNVQKFLRSCEHINMAEGHPQAGGVKLLTRDLDKFREFVNSSLSDNSFDSTIEYDLELSVSNITEDLIIQVEKFDYLTGQGFPRAMFKVTNLFYDKDGRKVIGKNKDAVKIALDDITLIKFGVSDDYASDIPDMSEIEVVGRLNLNIWVSDWGREYRTNQVLMEDYHIMF